MIAVGSFNRHNDFMYSFDIFTSLGKLVIRRLVSCILEKGFSFARISAAKYSRGCFYLAISSV
ncbi:MAG: hypothetical protein ACKO96_33290, partial [Flammeovirgaceae bacterium]